MTLHSIVYDENQRQKGWYRRPRSINTRNGNGALWRPKCQIVAKIWIYRRREKMKYTEMVICWRMPVGYRLRLENKSTKDKIQRNEFENTWRKKANETSDQEDRQVRWTAPNCSLCNSLIKTKSGSGLCKFFTTGPVIIRTGPCYYSHSVTIQRRTDANNWPFACQFDIEMLIRFKYLFNLAGGLHSCSSLQLSVLNSTALGWRSKRIHRRHLDTEGVNLLTQQMITGRWFSVDKFGSRSIQNKQSTRSMSF